MAASCCVKGCYNEWTHKIKITDTELMKIDHHQCEFELCKIHADLIMKYIDFVVFKGD